MRQATDRILSAVEYVGMAIALLALVLMMLGITADAFGRYFLHSPIKGQYEFTALYLMVMLSFLGLARSQARGGHIAIPILEDPLARVPFQLPQRLTALIAACAFAMLTWVTGHEALERIAARTTTFGAVQFPTYLSYCWVPVGTCLLTLRVIHQAIWPLARP